MVELDNWMLKIIKSDFMTVGSIQRIVITLEDFQQMLSKVPGSTG